MQGLRCDMPILALAIQDVRVLFSLLLFVLLSKRLKQSRSIQDQVKYKQDWEKLVHVFLVVGEDTVWAEE